MSGVAELEDRWAEALLEAADDPSDKVKAKRAQELRRQVVEAREAQARSAEEAAVLESARRAREREARREVLAAERAEQLAQAGEVLDALPGRMAAAVAAQIEADRLWGEASQFLTGTALPALSAIGADWRSVARTSGELMRAMMIAAQAEHWPMDPIVTVSIDSVRRWFGEPGGPTPLVVQELLADAEHVVEVCSDALAMPRLRLAEALADPAADVDALLAAEEFEAAQRAAEQRPVPMTSPAPAPAAEEPSAVVVALQERMSAAHKRAVEVQTARGLRQGGESEQARLEREAFERSKAGVAAADAAWREFRDAEMARTHGAATAVEEG